MNRHTRSTAYRHLYRDSGGIEGGLIIPARPASHFGVFAMVRSVRDSASTLEGQPHGPSSQDTVQRRNRTLRWTASIQFTAPDVTILRVKPS